MSFMTREDRYNYLCEVKRGLWGPNTGPLTKEEEAFIVEFATEKFEEVMKDPEVVAVMRRMSQPQPEINDNYSAEIRQLIVQRNGKYALVNPKDIEDLD